jgi:hypothetical protein
MKLWGKVMSGFLLVMAAMFVVVTFIVPPETRLIMATTAVLLLAAGLFGVPALVRFFISFTVDEELLANGAVASATITAVKPTRWRYNRYYPIVNFCLNVELDGAAYPVEIRQAIDPELLAKLAPGGNVRVRIDRLDRSRVAIDTREPIRGI